MSVLTFAGKPSETQAILTEIAKYVRNVDDLVELLGHLRAFTNRKKTGHASLQFHFKDGTQPQIKIETAGYVLTNRDSG